MRAVQIKEILDEQNADNTSPVGKRYARAAHPVFPASARIFTPHEFNSVYNFKYELEGTVLKLANINVLENLEVINNAASTQPVNLCYAPESGIITYSIDGYEDKAPSDLTDADFQKDNYEKTQLISNEADLCLRSPLPTFHQRKLENRNSGRPHDSSAVRERAVRQSPFPQKPV